MTTPLQKEMLISIAESEHTKWNGGPPDNHFELETWGAAVIKTPADKGTFTSLIKADLAWHCGNGADSVVGLTEAGFQAYLEARKEN